MRNYKKLLTEDKNKIKSKVDIDHAVNSKEEELPTKEEFKNIIKQLKNRKTEESDGICYEVIKAGGYKKNCMY